jgi:hypothetical protein
VDIQLVLRSHKFAGRELSGTRPFCILAQARVCQGASLGSLGFCEEVGSSFELPVSQDPGRIDSDPHTRLPSVGLSGSHTTRIFDVRLAIVRISFADLLTVAEPITSQLGLKKKKKGWSSLCPPLRRLNGLCTIERFLCILRFYLALFFRRLREWPQSWVSIALPSHRYRYHQDLVGSTHFRTGQHEVDRSVCNR